VHTSFKNPHRTSTSNTSFQKLISVMVRREGQLIARESDSGKARESGHDHQLDKLLLSYNPKVALVPPQDKCMKKRYNKRPLQTEQLSKCNETLKTKRRCPI
jgi:hypothetical protein